MQNLKHLEKGVLVGLFDYEALEHVKNLDISNMKWNKPRCTTVLKCINFTRIMPIHLIVS